MNYIELFGISASGKTHIKNEMSLNLRKKNLRILDQKVIIIQFYLKNNSINFTNYLKGYFLLFFYSRFATSIKYFFKRKRNVKKNKNKVYFFSSKKKWYHNIIDNIGLENQYLGILKLLEIKLGIKRNYYLYKIMLKEITKLKQDTIFKDKFNKWFLENIILIEILKKRKNIYCVVDEGIVHKIFIIFSLIENNRLFIKKIIKYVDNYGDLYLIKTNLKNIRSRSLERKRKSKEFIYQNYQQVVKEYNNLRLFEKLIKNKIIYKKILN